MEQQLHLECRNILWTWMLDFMVRYYCHIRQGKQLVPDPDGVELPSLDVAQTYAVEAIRDVLAEGIRRGDDSALDDVLIIADEAGQELQAIPFTQGLPPRLRGR
jgi:hypothetical protein